MFTKLRSKKAFTLVEIMIVVAIIGLLVAIAIPNLLRARLSANEGAAEGSMRTLITALENYRADQNPPGYPANLPVLAGAVPPYIDAVLAAGTKQGYNYIYATVGVADANGNFPDGYSITANPVTAGVTGNNGYFTDQTGVIRVANPAPANAASPPLQ